MVRKKTMINITEKIERRKSTNITGPAAIMASRILVVRGRIGCSGVGACANPELCSRKTTSSERKRFMLNWDLA
jgi:hypothetical protein